MKIIVIIATLKVYDERTTQKTDKQHTNHGYLHAKPKIKDGKSNGSLHSEWETSEKIAPI